MFEKLVIWGVIFVVFCFLYIYLSTVNPAYGENNRNVALLKIKTRTGKYIYKPIACKKAVLKEFVYTKNFNHLKIKGIKGITSIYMYDRDGRLYQFEKNIAKPQSIDQVKSFIDATRPSFFDIYNFMTVNKFVGNAVRIVEHDEREKRNTTKPE